MGFWASEAQRRFTSNMSSSQNPDYCFSLCQGITIPLIWYVDYVDYNVPFIRILMNQPVLTWFMLYSRYLKVAERSMFFRPLTPQKSIIGRPLVQGFFFRQISNDHCYHIHKIVVWSQAEHRHEFRFKVWNTTNLHKILGHFSCFSVSLWSILWNTSSGDSKGQKSGRLILSNASPLGEASGDFGADFGELIHFVFETRATFSLKRNTSKCS